MNYLISSDIDFIIHEQLMFLPSTVSIYRPVTTNTALGTVKQRYILKTVKARISAIGDRRSESVYQHETSLDVQKTDFTHTCTFPVGTNIQIEDIVIWGTREFAVVALLSKHSYETAERVYMTECL